MQLWNAYYVAIYLFLLIERSCKFVREEMCLTIYCDYVSEEKIPEGIQLLEASR